MKKSYGSIPWFGPQMTGNEKKYLQDVIDSNYINDGTVTRQLEEKVANLLGVQFAVGVTSGTVAISLALMGLGIGEGDEVIIPNLTFVATANAVRLCGAKVKLVDIDRTRFCIDIARVEEAITAKTKAIVPVDVNGRGADYSALEALCKKYGLYLVSDAAEALGSKWNGRYLGTFGNAGCFSFSANKTLSTGQGGMIVTNDEDLHAVLRELKDQGRRFQGSGGDDLHPVVGYNFKLTNIQSAVGLAQFEQLQTRLDGARSRQKWYREELSDIEGVILPPVNDADGEVLQWTDILLEDRSKVKYALDKEGIGCRAFWFPISSQKPYANVDLEFPNSAYVSERGLWLPSSFSLSRDDVSYTCAHIRSVLGK
ncbi:MAG: DegT/DnrJ/EryC1/StrS family aminotransferase [Pseudomonadota bacterium]|nr:DegT/DnrJ/EryC1/StrS family aminotransferase [Pseudomonadota bacterium]